MLAIDLRLAIPLALLLLLLPIALLPLVLRLRGEARRARSDSELAIALAARDAESRADEARELLDELTEAHRIIREREQIFRVTFDRSPLGAALVARDGRFLRVNHALCVATGYLEAELLRRDVFALIAPEDHDAAQAEADRLLFGAERVSVELRGRRADGGMVWLNVIAGPVCDDSGQPIHFLIMVEDISPRKQAELHQALILRTIPDPLWFKDMAGRYVLWSDAFLALHRRSAAEVAGRRAAEIMPPSLAAGVEESDAIVLATRQPFQRERRAAAPEFDGERWLDTTKTLVCDEDGQPLGIIGITRDITERKAAEEALRRSNERLELALWGAGLGLWDWHIPSGKMEVNAQLPGLLGLEPGQFAPPLDVWTAHTHPDDLPQVQAAFRETIDGRSEIVELEFRVRHADGSWRWNYARGRAVERDGEGRAVRLVGVTRDITARRQAEEQLREREALLRSISDSMPDGLIFQMERAPDGSGSFRYISAGVQQLWGVSPEQAYADPESVWSRIHPDDRAAFERAADHARKTLGIFDIEMRVLLPDGRQRWSASRSTAELLPDGRVLRNGVEIDITARKRAEADLRRRLDELLSLNQIAQALTGWTNIRDGLATVSGLLRRLFAARAVVVWEYDAADGSLTPLLATAQRAIAATPVAARLIERQAATVQLLSVADPLLGGDGAAGAPQHHTMLVALRARNTVLGLLCIGAARSEQLYAPADLSLAQTVAGVLASALDNARLFAQARATAAEQERQRLARELHDSVSQALFAANRTAEMLPQLWELDPEEGREALEDLRRCTSGALAEMRALLFELRPRALAEAPLHESLGSLLPAVASRGALAVESSLAHTPPLPPEVQVALYRVTQEALSNVSKHARARCASVRLAVMPAPEPERPWAGDVTITIADDGRGFDPHTPYPGHFGMLTMRERATAIGASLSLESAPGSGTTVTVTWRGSAHQQEADA